MSRRKDPRRLNPNVAKLVDTERAMHRPKRRMPHVADEYEAQNVRDAREIAAELRRHLRGRQGSNARAYLNHLSRRGPRGH